MALVSFGEWRPDVADFQGSTTQTILNVLPRGDGYGPAKALVQFSSALAGACRGAYYVRKSDGTISVFAATSTRIYRLNNTTFAWDDLSQGGSAYTTLASTDNWQFAQFGNQIIAVQANVVPQKFDISVGSAFADLGGSPPTARYVAVVGHFLVLSGIVGHETRVQWSDLDGIETWTAGTGFSNYTDFPDGGVVRGVAGGEFGLVLQETVTRQMTYIPGAKPAFQIERLGEEIGLVAPYSLIRAGARLFFYSTRGFQEYTGSQLVPIGKERVDRTVAADLDTSALQLMVGASDPANTRVYWGYKSIAGLTGLFDKMVVYDYVLDRWSVISQTGEYIASMTKPGVTLEGLDAIAPTQITISGTATNGGKIKLTVNALSNSNFSLGTVGSPSQNYIVVQGVGGTTNANGTWTYTCDDSTHITLQTNPFTGAASVYSGAYTSGGAIGGSMDALTFSLDDVSSAVLSSLSVIDSSHKLGFLSGTNMEATMETPEQGLGSSQRTMIDGIMPITDAPTVYGYLKIRSIQGAVSVKTTESLMDTNGMSWQGYDTRYARAGLRIPAGTVWTFAAGAEPQARPTGQA